MLICNLQKAGELSNMPKTLIIIMCLIWWLIDGFTIFLGGRNKAKYIKILQIRGAVWCHTRSVQITLGQYSHFTPPKNTKKIKGFLVFPGAIKWLTRNW